MKMIDTVRNTASSAISGSRLERVPLTPLGWSVGFFAVLSYLVGWVSGWVEFFALAVGLALALLLAVPFVVGGRGLRIERSVTPERVQVGEAASSILTISNDGNSPSAPRTVEDRIGESVIRIDVPAISSGGFTNSVTSLPTSRRRVLDVGPAIVTRADPIGLLRVDLGRTPTDRLWVHPRYTALASARAGFAKDLEGPTFDNSPSGDVAFHAIREYQRGDDVRHIHWMSTARTGNLMVRHFVDNRRPHIAVQVDDRVEGMYPERFETAIEVMASQVVSANIDGRPLTAWVGTQQVISKTEPADQQTALDRLCLSEMSNPGSDPIEVYRRLRQIDRDVSTLLFITGSRSAQDLLPLVLEAAQHGQVIVGRIVPSGEPSISLPRATVIDAVDLKDFAFAWASLVAP